MSSRACQHFAAYWRNRMADCLKNAKTKRICSIQSKKDNCQMHRKDFNWLHFKPKHLITLHILLHRLFRSVLVTVTVSMAAVAVAVIWTSVHHCRRLLAIHVHFLLRGKLLDCLEALLTHLYSLRQITHRGIFYIFVCLMCGLYVWNVWWEREKQNADIHTEQISSSHQMEWDSSHIVTRTFDSIT